MRERRCRGSSSLSQATGSPSLRELGPATSARSGLPASVLVLLLLLRLLFLPFSPIQSKISTFLRLSFRCFFAHSPTSASLPPSPACAASSVIECHYDDDSFGLLRSLSLRNVCLPACLAWRGSRATLLRLTALASRGPLCRQFLLPRRNDIGD